MLDTLESNFSDLVQDQDFVEIQEKHSYPNYRVHISNIPPRFLWIGTKYVLTLFHFRIWESAYVVSPGIGSLRITSVLLFYPFLFYSFLSSLHLLHPSSMFAPLSILGHYTIDLATSLLGRLSWKLVGRFVMKWTCAFSSPALSICNRYCCSLLLQRERDSERKKERECNEILMFFNLKWLRSTFLHISPTSP
jgi:hypothetical protein